MADSNSQPPRCSCGFFGTAENMGLCSKCFAEQKKKSGDRSDISASGASNNGSASELTPDIVIQAVSEVAASLKVSSNFQSSGLELNEATVDSTNVLKSCVEVVESNGSDLSGTQTPTGVKRDSSAIADPSKPEQRNKKRCFKCNIKLDLAHREIGRCRCEYIFCSAHRLPEQHDCKFNHKEEGRKADSEKMVLPTRHGGRSFQRLDSDRN